MINYADEISRLQNKIAQLEAENQLYKSVVETIPKGIQVFDERGRCVYLNQKQKEIHKTVAVEMPNNNYTLAESSLAAMHNVEISAEKVLDNTLQTVSYTAKTVNHDGECLDAEIIEHFYLFRLKNNLRYIFSLADVVISADVDNKSGRLDDYYWLLEKFKAENKALIDDLDRVTSNERQLIETQKIAKIGDWYFDVMNPKAYWSKSSYWLFGIDENIVGDDLKDAIRAITHPDDLQIHLDKMNECMKGVPFENSYRIQYGDGYKTILSVGQPVYDESNKIIALQGYYQDITERQKYIEEIEKKNIFIQTVLDNLPIGIALNTFNERKVSYMNKKFEEIYGWQSHEISTSDDFFMKVYPDENYRNRIKQLIESDIKSGDPDRMKWNNIEITQSNGVKRIINASNIPICEQNQMVSTVIDITDVKEYQQKLIEAKEKAEENDNLKTAFLQNLSHEIRTPMNGIVGFSEILKNVDFCDDHYKKYLDIIVDNCDQLLNIVTDIVTISSIETRQESLTYEAASLNELTGSVYNAFYEKAKHGHIGLVVKNGLDDDDCWINTDASKLLQIVTNLVGNAIKFTSKGTVEFGYSIKNDILHFYVSDTGIGIAKEMHDKIFERFRQAEVEISKQYGGIGLGLTISKGLLEMMDGEIWLESELGKGSTFYFTIPYISAAVKDSFVNQKVIVPKKEFTILVAEDDDVNFLVLRELLSKFYIHIIRATNGNEVLNICNSNPAINLILMDIKMPEMDGHTVAKILRENNFTMPIIAQTAYALHDEIDKFEGVFDSYLTKPLKKELFMSTIEQYVSYKQ